MSKPGSLRRRARLLRFAKAVQWLGIVLNFSCWGYALLELKLNQSLSDAISDATPLILLGGIAFTVTYFVAWVLKNLAMRSAHR
jgi:hypothetical protein